MREGRGRSACGVFIPNGHRAPRLDAISRTSVRVFLVLLLLLLLEKDAVGGVPSVVVPAFFGFPFWSCAALYGNEPRDSSYGGHPTVCDFSLFLLSVVIFLVCVGDAW